MHQVTCYHRHVRCNSAFVAQSSAPLWCRRVTVNMDERFPDATAEDLERSDNICIICREEMTASSRNKKLSCSHVFHLHCLRSCSSMLSRSFASQDVCHVSLSSVCMTSGLGHIAFAQALLPASWSKGSACEILLDLALFCSILCTQSRLSVLPNVACSQSELGDKQHPFLVSRESRPDRSFGTIACWLCSYHYQKFSHHLF